MRLQGKILPPARGDHLRMPDEPIAQLLADARNGSAAALGRAIDGCREYLLLIAGRELDARIRSKVGSSDLVQETLLEAQQHFARFHGTTRQELLRWVRRILLRNIANATRRYRATSKRSADRERRSEADAAAGGIADAEGHPPDDAAIAGEERARVLQAIERLPEDYRQVILARSFDGLSFDEVGARLGRSADAARRLWVRALDRLRSEMEGRQ
jgi:RNA polymerase sigma-70 factor (ECF subfamily)